MKEEIESEKSTLATEAQIPTKQSPNTGLIIQFRRVWHLIENNGAADKSRRCSRIIKGLNPDIPRPVNGNPPPPINLKEEAERRANEKAEQISKMDQHKIALEQLCYRFGTNLQTGLTTQQAIKRNAQEGDNKFSQKKKQPTWRIFLSQITNLFAILLWFASLLCLITYIVQQEGNLHYLWLSLLLIFIITLTASFTYIQSPKPKPLMQGFKDMLPSVCKVLRDDKITQIHADKLVRGDIVEVHKGQKIPADIRLINCEGMQVDNSSLTGQLQPVLLNNQCTHPDNPLQSKNLAFFGTLCKEGQCRGIVIRIAQKTMIGQIVQLVSQQKTEKSPIKIQIERFIFIIAIVTICLSVICFFIALFVIGYSTSQCLILGIGIIISSIPQGLLICISLSLIIASHNITERKMYIKNLQSIITLGSTTCICSNKTGTFTQSTLSIEHLWYDGEVKIIKKNQFIEKNLQEVYDANDPSFQILHHAAIICSQDPCNDQSQSSNTDAFETALIKFYQTIQNTAKTRQLYSYASNKNGFPSKMPFNSTNKYSLSIIQLQNINYNYIVYIKGAPQKLWNYCGRILHQGKYKNITQQEKKHFNQINHKFCKNGQTVLGFAMLPLNKQTYSKGYKFSTSSPQTLSFPLQNFIFIGLISFKNPPKPSTKPSIKKCQQAGIKVIMITGDQPTTATTIAKQTGIIKYKTNDDLKEEGFTNQQPLKNANALIIHGDMITKPSQQGNEAGDTTLTEWVSKPQIIFARTTPSQKLLIIRACQNIGNIVTVIGNNLHDSPAIKQSDIGISMGISGCTITKDASDMILLNDDFPSIVDGIEEGRRILDNLKKMVVYMMTSNIAQIWPFIALVLFQIPLPLSNIFMLCICIGTDIYPALSLAYEEAEADIMTRRPKKVEQHLMSKRLLAHSYANMGQIATCGGFFTYFVVMRLYGFPPHILFGLLSKTSIIPQKDNLSFNSDNCEFDQFAPNLGCSGFILPCRQEYTTIYDYPNWFSTLNNKMDLRGVYSQCGDDGFYKPLFVFPVDVLNTYSNISKHTVAYTTESIFYAQSAYFATIVMVQWSNLLACKSRKVSVIHTGFNKHMIGGVIAQTLILLILLYIPGINFLFGGRPLNFFILGVPGLGFSMLLLLWEESRKFLINQNNNDGKPNWWELNLLW